MILIKIQERASGLKVTEYQGKFDILDKMYVNEEFEVTGEEEKACYALMDFIKAYREREAKKKQEPYEK